MGQEAIPIAFFSYCREDSEFALKLAADLKGAGAHVWIDQLDIEPGTPWDRAVEEALMNSPRMLVVLSPVSVNSDNVRDEVSFALSRQKRVIPVLYRDCDVPFRLARLQHIDFRPDYERALTILLRALGVGHAPQAQPSAVAAAATVDETAVSPAETDNARQQKLEEERRLSEDQAQLEQARKYAGEQKRLKEERLEAAKQEASQERQQPETADPAVQEQSRREQRVAEQARLEEDARLAAERVRLAQQEKERREAEIKARQEQLRREEQESVERKSFNLDSQLSPQEREPEQVRASAALAPAAKRPRIEPLPTPASAPKVPMPSQPESSGVNLASLKYLIIGAAVVTALALIIFLLAHRNGPQSPTESKVAESDKPTETAAIPQPQNQASAATNPTEPAPSPPSPSAASPTNAPNQDAAKEKSPAATDKELTKATTLASGTPNSGSNAVNAASTSNRVRLSQGVSHGMLMYEIAPKYPALARSAHVQGEVVLAVVIGKDGSVADIKAESGHPLLIPAAIDAVKRWRYKPYRLNGKPVEVDTRVIVNFTLTNQ